MSKLPEISALLDPLYAMMQDRSEVVVCVRNDVLNAHRRNALKVIKGLKFQVDRGGFTNKTECAHWMVLNQEELKSFNPFMKGHPGFTKALLSDLLDEMKLL